MYTVSEYVEFTNNQEISKSRLRLAFYDTRCTFHEIGRSNQGRFIITSYQIGRNVIRNRIENQHKRSWKVQFAFPDECHHLRLTLVFTYIGSFSSSDTSSCWSHLFFHSAFWLLHNDPIPSTEFPRLVLLTQPGQRHRYLSIHRLLRSD